jgi:hypothetical protein
MIISMQSIDSPILLSCKTQPRKVLEASALGQIKSTEGPKGKIKTSSKRLMTHD